MAPKAAAAGASANAKAKAKAKVAPRMRVRRQRVLRSKGDSYRIPFHKSATEQGSYLDFLWEHGDPHEEGIVVNETLAAQQIARFFITCTEDERGRHLARILLHGTPSIMRKIAREYQVVQKRLASMLLRKPALAVTVTGVCVPVRKAEGRLIE